MVSESEAGNAVIYLTDSCFWSHDRVLVALQRKYCTFYSGHEVRSVSQTQNLLKFIAIYWPGVRLQPV